MYRAVKLLIKHGLLPILIKGKFQKLCSRHIFGMIHYYTTYLQHIYITITFFLSLTTHEIESLYIR